MGSFNDVNTGIGPMPKQAEAKRVAPAERARLARAFRPDPFDEPEASGLGTRVRKVRHSDVSAHLRICLLCGMRVGGRKERVLVANIYRDGAWNRVEYWHGACYRETGEPYGRAT